MDRRKATLGEKWYTNNIGPEKEITVIITLQDARHIARKMLHMPTHMKIEEEVELDITILKKLGFKDLIGDIQTALARRET